MKGRLERVAAATLAAAAVVLGGCGEEGGERGEPDEGMRTATIEQILEDPQNFDEEIVRVPGRAYPAGDRGFVLASSGSSIWVASPAGTTGLRRGERVFVRGEVERLTQENADVVDQALRSPTEPGLPPPPDDVIEQTPAAVGEPFVTLRAISNEG